MMTDPLSVLIIDGGSHNGIPLYVARCLAQVPSLRLHVLSERLLAPLFFSRRRHTFRAQSNHNKDGQWLEIIKQTIKRTESKVILPIMERAIRFVAVHQDTLGEIAAVAPVPPVEAFDRVVDKGSLVTLTAELGIPSPPSVVYKPNASLERQVRELPFPVLAKPTLGSSGEGMKYFDHQDDLKAFVRGLNSKKNVPQYVIQSFVPGFDLGCNVLCKNGEILAYTAYKGFIARSKRFAPSAGVEYIQDDRVLEIAQKLFSPLRWSGVANIDLRYDRRDQRPKLLEVNPRFWGSLPGTCVAAKVNFPYLACLTALGVSFARPKCRLGRFVDFRGVVEQTSRRVLGRGGYHWTVNETNLGQIATDPVAEAARIISNRSFSKVSIFPHH